MKKKLKKAQVGASVPKTSPEMIPNVANAKAYINSNNEAYVTNRLENERNAYRLKRAKLRRDLELAQNEALRKHLLNTLPPMITPKKK